MNRPAIIAASVALATGFATACLAAEGTESGATVTAPAQGSTNSGKGINGGNVENKSLPGGRSGDDTKKPGNGDHGNNGGNGG